MDRGAVVKVDCLGVFRTSGKSCGDSQGQFLITHRRCVKMIVRKKKKSCHAHKFWELLSQWSLEDQEFTLFSTTHSLKDSCTSLGAKGIFHFPVVTMT